MVRGFMVLQNYFTYFELKQSLWAKSKDPCEKKKKKKTPDHLHLPYMYIYKSRVLGDSDSASRTPIFLQNLLNSPFGTPTFSETDLWYSCFEMPSENPEEQSSLRLLTMILKNPSV